MFAITNYIEWYLLDTKKEPELDTIIHWPVLILSSEIVSKTGDNKITYSSCLEHLE